MTEIANLPWHILYALLMVIVIVAALVLSISTLRTLRRKGVAILRVAHNTLDPASIQAVVLTFATVVGALWVAYVSSVTGAHALKRYQLERAELLDTPTLELEIVTTLLGTESQSLRPVEVQIHAKNNGVRAVALDLTKVPLLSIAQLDVDDLVREYPIRSASSIDRVDHLPHLKIECSPRAENEEIRWRPSCAMRTWSSAMLEPGGSGYYTFLHPGLAPGLYLAQFSLPIAQDLLVGEFDPDRPVLWSRSKYFEVPSASISAMKRSDESDH